MPNRLPVKKTHFVAVTLLIFIKITHIKNNCFARSPWNIKLWKYLAGAPTMALTKTNIVDQVQERIGYSRKRSSDLVETLIEIIKDTIGAGEDVLVSGFGKFCVKEKGARKGRNPATGDDMMLEQRKVVTFKCSSVLRDRINEPL